MVAHLNKEGFKESVFDFEKETAWKYNGSLPAIVEFSAKWCGPCKMLEPALEKISEKYRDKLVVYSVDVDEEPEIANMFSISSVPTMFFIAMEGKPEYVTGALPEKDLEKILNDIIFKTKPVS